MKLWALRMMLLISSSLLVLGLGELIARRISTSRNAEFANVLAKKRGVEKSGLPAINGLIELARPDQHGVHRGVNYTTNSRGLRAPEVARCPEPETFRIAVGGDSIAVGWGVEEELRYSSRLEQLLEAEPIGSWERHEVINMALAGLNAKLGVRRLLHHASHYRADLIVFGFTLNDVEGDDYVPLVPPSERAREQRQEYFSASGSLFMRSHLARAVLAQWAALRRLTRPDPTSILSELRHNYFENPAAWSQVESAFDDLARFGEDNGVCTQVLIHTELGQLGWLHPYHDMYDQIVETARGRGLHASATFEAFRGYPSERLWVHHLDPHPNPEGHELLAGALREALGELPASCWERAAQRARCPAKVDSKPKRRKRRRSGAGSRRPRTPSTAQVPRGPASPDARRAQPTGAARVEPSSVPH